MKKIMYVLVIILLLVGCGTKTDSGSKEEEVTPEGGKDEVQEDKLLTKEFIMKKYGFTEEDFKNLDVEKIVEFYGFTEENIRDTSKSNILGVLSYYQERLEEDKIAREKDKSYLMEAGPYTGEDLDVSSLKYLALMLNEGDLVTMTFLDFIDKKAYYAKDYKLVEDRDLAEMIGTIEEKDIDNLVKQLEDVEFQNWKGLYLGNNGGTTGSSSWQLGMEFADGIVVTYKGGGMYGENQPKGFEKVKDRISGITHYESVNQEETEEN